MKTSAVLVAVAAALVSAQAPPEGTNKINCAKPNSNYCLGDIIVRCDEHSVGTAGRCSANVAGYPPAGGVASCYESAKDAGDAACVKNCVVYAQPSFTLPASQCVPSYTASATAAPEGTSTSIYVQPSGPASSAPGTSTITYVQPSGPASSAPGTSTTIYVNPGAPHSTGVLPPSGGNGGNGTGPTGTNTPVGPTSAGPSTVPTNAAVANHATGALAIMGLVAAAFL
ncbi:hypothetical protein V8C42DRAFT_83473 [Trichoderma barbatum]